MPLAWLENANATDGIEHGEQEEGRVHHNGLRRGPYFAYFEV